MRTTQLLFGDLPTTPDTTMHGRLCLVNCSLKNSYYLELFSVHSEYAAMNFPFPFVHQSSFGNLLITDESIFTYDLDWQNKGTLLTTTEITERPSFIRHDDFIYGCNGVTVFIKDAGFVTTTAGTNDFPLFQNVCDFNGQVVGISPVGLTNVPSTSILFGSLRDSSFSDIRMGAEARILTTGGKGLGVHAFNNNLIALLENTIEFIYPVDNFLGQRVVASPGVLNRNVYAGSKQLCLYLNTNYELCSCDAEGKVSTLGYKWLLETLVNPYLTYDYTSNTYTISDATTTFIFRDGQLIRTTHSFSSMVNNKIFGTLGADYAALHYTDLLANKRAMTNLLYVTGKNLVECAFTTNIGANTFSKVVPANTQYTSTLNLPGMSFDVLVKFAAETKNIQMEFQQLDRRSVRSRYVEENR